MSRKISHTREDYIRAIYKLQELDDNNQISTTSLAKHMSLAKSTVSEQIKTLTQLGYVSSPHYGKISLAKKGLKLAKELTFKHRVIETFLHQILEMPPKDVHKEAHKLEHAFSLDVVKRLHRFMNSPNKDPHGSPIELGR